ncbi:MAG: YidH family protein [Ilumatobacteraceae bacterium]
MKLREYLFPPDPRGWGVDPDYRFTLANERTFLSWIRTSLALVAGGLGSIVVLKDIEGVEVIGVMVLALAFVTASTSFRRWSLNERAMRLEQPLPASYLPQITAIGVALIGVAAVILLVIDSQ